MSRLRAALDPIAEHDAAALGMAAVLAWELGDAESSVRQAQAAMRALVNRQVRDASVALLHGDGGVLSSHVSMFLERER